MLGVWKQDYIPRIKQYLCNKHDEYLKVLYQIPLFECIGQTLAYRICGVIKPLNYIQSQYVYHEEDEGKTFYIVDSGEFEVFIMEGIKEDDCNSSR